MKLRRKGYPAPGRLSGFETTKLPELRFRALLIGESAELELARL